MNRFNDPSCADSYEVNGDLIQRKNGSNVAYTGRDATDDEIRDCITLAKPRRPYSLIKYNCKDWAKQAAQKCGLDCN
jgi:hypothetical protein